MDNNIQHRFDAKDRSYFAILKKEIHNLVSEAGFSKVKVGEVDIIVAEIASNLVKHAGGGELLVRLFKDEGEQAIEIISIDKGPGMADPAKMIRDGVSTSNTLGHGLGSIKRLSDFFEVYSLKGWGTILLTRVYKKASHAFLKPRTELRSIVVAKPGETLSGDGYWWHLDEEGFHMFLGDGLGHGKDAHHAVSTAINLLNQFPADSPIDALRKIHTGVKKTRGLVGTIASYSFKEKMWKICGIGNISSRVHCGLAIKNHMAYNGILGLNIPNTIKEQEFAYERGQIIIMCSDGIKARFDLQKYPGIFKYDLSILAAAIFSDYARETDDMSVIIGRVNLN